MAELTPSNSPKYGEADIKKQNRLWRKRVKDHARGLSDEALKEYIRYTTEVLQRTENIAVGLQERQRLEILEDVLLNRRDKASS